MAVPGGLGGRRSAERLSSGAAGEVLCLFRLGWLMRMAIAEEIFLWGRCALHVIETQNAKWNARCVIPVDSAVFFMKMSKNEHFYLIESFVS